MIKVLLADDHALIREGMRQLLELERDIEVVGDAKDGIEVQRKVEQLQPDVVLMDINMPIANGVVATKQIVERHPTIGVIMLTMYRQDQHVFEAIRAGARGYLLKDCLASEVVAAIRSIAGGASLIDPKMATAVLHEFRRMSEKTSSEGGIDGLNERDRDILRLVAAGLSNREIADRLSFSERTIKNYLSNIFATLNLRDRTQAAIYALSQGLIPVESVGGDHRAATPVLSHQR